MCNAKLHIVHNKNQAKSWEIDMSHCGGSIQDSCPQHELTAIKMFPKKLHIRKRER